MSLGPTLETARLLLRPPAHEDFDAFAAMAQEEEETMRFIGGVMPRDGAWRLLATLRGAWALLGYSMFSVIEKKSGRWIGRLGPWRPGGEEGGWPGPEFGWGPHRGCARQGLRLRGRRRRDRLGFRFAGVGPRHPLHRQAERALDQVG
jgi:RimJ/RimL family protein N-acetyltransferase